MAGLEVVILGDVNRVHGVHPLARELRNKHCVARSSLRRRVTAPCSSTIDERWSEIWRRVMKTVIAALALVTLIASPTFARSAARASPQAEFVFPTDQQLCQSGQTDFCHWRGYPLWQWYSGG
jgi:hypothetical protein